MFSYLGAAHLQTLDHSVPALRKAVQPGLQLVSHLFVFYAGQQILTHGAQLIHGGPLRLQVCLHHLGDKQHIESINSACTPAVFNQLLKSGQSKLVSEVHIKMVCISHSKTPETGHHLRLVLKVGGLDGANQLLLLSQPRVKQTLCGEGNR